jgi:hypothetical protein
VEEGHAENDCVELSPISKSEQKVGVIGQLNSKRKVKASLDLKSTLPEVLVKQILRRAACCSIVESLEQEEHHWISAVSHYVWLHILALYSDYRLL